MKDRILIVDDELDLLEGLEITLKAHDFEVLKATNGQEGLESALREQPDLILMDVMMPHMNGIEACRKMRTQKELAQTPILLVTALADLESKIRGLISGADDFVTKPYEEEELFARINSFLRNRHLQTELKEAYNRLRKAEEMREALIGMVVHDLKGPLTAIWGGIAVVLSAMEAHEPLLSTHQQLLKNGQVSTKKLLTQINTMLDLAKLEEVEVNIQQQTFDLCEVIHRTIAEFQTITLVNNVKLIFSFDHSVSCTGDTVLIERVLMNLILNAVKYSPAQGTVEITLREDPDKVEVSVADQGIGIDKDNLEKIFDKYFQVEGKGFNRKGHGIGLAFCQLAIKAHGGRIWVESSPGQGATFHFVIPRRAVGSGQLNSKAA